MTAPTPTPSPVPAQPAPTVLPLKPGYKTTELALVVLTDIGMIASSAADWLPPRYAALGATIASAAYALARGLAKLYPPKPAA